MGRRHVVILFRRLLLLVFVGSIVALVPHNSLAASVANVAEQRVTEDAVYLYINHAGNVKSAEAQIGKQSADGVRILPSDQVPIVTWLLLDNSVSISKEDRAKAKELFIDLVAGKGPNEKFVLATYNEKLNILVQDSDSYVDLKAQIDGIQHNDQVSYLTDVLEEILDLESTREEQTFVRIILVCDGVDQNPSGYTREELDTRLKTNNIPIYTFGCEGKNNEPLLKELYALSRQTSACNWSLTGLKNTLEATGALGGDELPTCAVVTIPEKLRDGSSKGIQLTFDDGTVVQTEATMPFGNITETVEPTPTPQPEPEKTDPQPTEPVPPEPSEEEGGFPILWIVIAVVAAIAVITIIVLLMRNKKEKVRIRAVNSNDDQISSSTDVLGDPQDGSTEILIHRDSQLTLILSDQSHPEYHYEVPLCGHVTIGRAPGNTVVIDYDRSVSGSHCEIYLEGTTFRLRDVGSKNGTFIDGIRVVDVAEISNGSTIRIGRLSFLVEIR